MKLVVSDRFTDEDGKPLEWEVRCISSREDETLRRDCQYRVQVPGKRGSFRRQAQKCGRQDVKLLQAEMCDGSLVIPVPNQFFACSTRSGASLKPQMSNSFSV